MVMSTGRYIALWRSQRSLTLEVFLPRRSPTLNEDIIATGVALGFSFSDDYVTSVLRPEGIAATKSPEQLRDSYTHREKISPVGIRDHLGRDLKGEGERRRKRGDDLVQAKRSARIQRLPRQRTLAGRDRGIAAASWRYESLALGTQLAR